MQRPVAIGVQSFSKLRENSCFYVDKTHFIKDWWEGHDDITLVTRPRRFGKTLTLDMVRTFFSPEYTGRTDLFEGLSIWNDEKFRSIQGTIPVVSLSFADIKKTNFSSLKEEICVLLSDVYLNYKFLLKNNVLDEEDKVQFKKVSADMSLNIASRSLRFLTKYIAKYYNLKPIILLDEYDTPLQEAWLHGYWEDAIAFFRGLFNSTFKTNPWLERGLMTGITRVSKESLFSDLNNLQVVTATSPLYADAFGFTEEEVFTAMDEYGLPDKDKVKAWYDGFVFGNRKDIYNPWSITNYLRTSVIDTYWVDTSSNALVSELVQQGDQKIKIQMEDMLKGQSIVATIDEQVVFSQLKVVSNAVLSLFIATGYLKVVSCNKMTKQYEIAITNHEVKVMMESLVRQWFNSASLRVVSQEFRRALCAGATARMNTMMRRIALETFSFFDMGGREPERFYHGFALGLLVDLKGRFQLESNRESGWGRYDVMLIPLTSQDPGIVIEFKALAEDEGERKLEDTARAALRQIAERQYAASLEARGVPRSRMLAYGFAFRGKDVLIAGGPWQEACRQIRSVPSRRRRPNSRAARHAKR